MSTPFVGNDLAACPQCSGTAELELQGDVQLYVCLECGAEFGYSRPGQQDETCQAGIPEYVRLRYSHAVPPGVVRLESGEQSQSVFLGTIGRRPSE